MRKGLIIFSLILGLVSCLPDGFDPATTVNIKDNWVAETYGTVETLELYTENAKNRFTWSRRIQNTDIVAPVTGSYNVRTTYDYGKKWYILTLWPDGDEGLVLSYKMTLSDDKRVLTLEGRGLTYYYRVEREKEKKSSGGGK